MRRSPPFVQAFFALVVFWLAAGVSAGAASSDAGGVPGVHRESVALSTPHVAIAGMATSRKVSSPDWSSRLFLPSQGFAARDGDVAASTAFALFALRDGASRTVTYDATAPPAAPNTVR